MGAWGTATFANDDAMDWLAELQAEGLEAAGTAVRVVSDIAPGYLEAPICTTALAAAEVIAALHHRPSADLPDEVSTWVAANAYTPPSDLTRDARQAVELILAESELRELWEDSPEFEEWLAGVQDLRARLT